MAQGQRLGVFLEPTPREEVRQAGEIVPADEGFEMCPTMSCACMPRRDDTTVSSTA